MPLGCNPRVPLGCLLLVLFSSSLALSSIIEQLHSELLVTECIPIGGGGRRLASPVGAAESELRSLLRAALALPLPLARVNSSAAAGRGPRASDAINARALMSLRLRLRRTTSRVCIHCSCLVARALPVRPEGLQWAGAGACGCSRHPIPLRLTSHSHCLGLPIATRFARRPLVRFALASTSEL